MFGDIQPAVPAFLDDNQLPGFRDRRVIALILTSGISDRSFQLSIAAIGLSWLNVTDVREKIKTV